MYKLEDPSQEFERLRILGQGSMMYLQAQNIMNVYKDIQKYINALEAKLAEMERQDGSLSKSMMADCSYHAGLVTGWNLGVKPSSIIDGDIDQHGVNLSEICWTNPEPSRCPKCGSRLFKAYGCTYNVAIDEGEQTGWHCLHCCSTFESTRIGSVIRTRITGNKPVQLLPGELKELRKDSARRSK